MPETTKQDTRARLLTAACEVFAERGYKNATVAEICETAEANIASINYYFGGKESLYDEVWRHAFELSSSTYPLDANLPDHPQLEDYLYSYANAILHRIFDNGAAGFFPKLLRQEMAFPTLALDRITKNVIYPQSRFLGDQVHRKLEGQIPDEDIRRCIHSIIGQCAFYNFATPIRNQVVGKRASIEKEIQRTARHIARFSMGGLNSITDES